MQHHQFTYAEHYPSRCSVTGCGQERDAEVHTPPADHDPEAEWIEMLTKVREMHEFVMGSLKPLFERIPPAMLAGPPPGMFPQFPPRR